jgi:hypothetical protein
VARVLIIAGGARGRTLAASLIAQGHAVRITTRDQDGRAAIESVGAECWIGTPESVTIACWLLGNACGDRDAVDALHSSRLEFFVRQTIDTTVRGLLYEAAGAVAAPTLAAGRELIAGLAAYNAIPLRVLDADPADPAAWVAQARAAVTQLMEPRGGER